MSGGKNLVPFLTKIIKTLGETGGLDTALQGCKVVAAAPGTVTVSLKVEDKFANRWK